MKILIIGGTGNISTSISHQLLEAGHDLTLFTLPEPGEMDSPIPDGAKSILGDRTDYADFESKVTEAGSFDCVIGNRSPHAAHALAGFAIRRLRVQCRGSRIR